MEFLLKINVIEFFIQEKSEDFSAFENIVNVDASDNQLSLGMY